jgi:hypothetical protein
MRLRPAVRARVALVPLKIARTFAQRACIVLAYVRTVQSIAGQWLVDAKYRMAASDSQRRDRSADDAWSWARMIVPYNSLRTELLRLLPAVGKRVLDVRSGGGGSGRTILERSPQGRALGRRVARSVGALGPFFWYVHVEANRARGRAIFPNEAFDAIFFNDVRDHTQDLQTRAWLPNACSHRVAI